jgi:hypothetical protein
MFNSSCQPTLSQDDLLHNGQRRYVHIKEQTYRSFGYAPYTKDSRSDKQDVAFKEVEISECLVLHRLTGLGPVHTFDKT